LVLRQCAASVSHLKVLPIMRGPPFARESALD